MIGTGGPLPCQLDFQGTLVMGVLDRSGARPAGLRQ